MKNKVAAASQTAASDNASLYQEQCVPIGVLPSRPTENPVKPSLKRACVDCGDPIALRRLVLKPQSSRCVECQAAFESVQKEEARIKEAQQTYHRYEPDEEEVDEDEAYLRSLEEVDEESSDRHYDAINSDYGGIGIDLSQYPFRSST